jgi:cytoskeletal protein RodZ
LTIKVKTSLIKVVNKTKEIYIKIDLNLLIKILAIIALLLLILALSVFLLKGRSQKEETIPATNVQTEEATTSPPTTKPTIKSPNPTPKPTPPYSSESEREEILEATKKYVESHSAPGQQFNLILESKVKKGRNEYALVHVEPWPAGSAEPAGAILQKIGGLWIVMDFGTLLMEWQEQVPELFNF